MSKPTFYVLAAVITLLAFEACNVFSSKMPREKFLNYYIDMLIMQDSLGRDSVSTQRIMTELNKKYDVTPKEYQATLDYYRDEPKEWSVFFDEAVTLVQKRQMEQRQTLSR